MKLNIKGGCLSYCKLFYGNIEFSWNALICHICQSRTKILFISGSLEILKYMNLEASVFVGGSHQWRQRFPDNLAKSSFGFLCSCLWRYKILEVSFISHLEIDNYMLLLGSFYLLGNFLFTLTKFKLHIPSSYVKIAGPLKNQNTPGTAGGPGGRDQTLAIKSRKNAFFFVKKKYLKMFFCFFAYIF